MSVVLPHKYIEEISTAKDPKLAIQDKVGDLSDLEIIGDRVLIAIYMRPEKTRGGIIRPDSNKAEDVWQGKVGLVLKCGPDAFLNPEDGTSYDQALHPGDWGVFFIGDGKPLHINDCPCRLVRDANFVARIKDPNMVL